MSIIKSSNDKSEYRSIVLDNKLEVVLIYDKDADLSSATMAVEVGYYSDPSTHFGLAHFLEHMLFMGTKKYPDIEYYHEFINKHGGSSNAYTSSENTNYYFDVQSEFFDETLDIFGHFFIDPLFDKSTVSKEMQAVDSEHSKNINNDSWRFGRVINKAARKDHPFSKFSTGNLETLEHEDTHEAMMNFYKEHYSANIMKLVVLSNKPLDKVETLVKNIFSQVKNINYKQQIYDGQPFDFSKTDNSAVCYKLIKVIPILDEQSIQIIWQLPDDKQYFMYKPIDYISNLLGHESKGSVIHYLRDKHWATSLYTGVYENDDSASMFLLSIDLTDEGFKYIPTIVESVYAYLNLIKVDKWRYDEIKTISHLNFKYLPKTTSIDRSLSTANNMLDYPVKYCLSAPYTYKEYAPKTKQLIKDFLKNFKKESSVVVISSKKYTDRAIKKEHYYGILYLDKLNPKEYGSEFNPLDKNSFSSSLFLPEKNVFIPKNISLKKILESSKYPQKILDEPNLNLWFKQDDNFKTPKVLLSVIIINNDFSSSVNNYTLLNLFVRIINYLLLSFGYYAKIASSNFTVSSGYESMTIKVSSYSNTLTQVIDEILSKFKLTDFSDSIYKIVKDEYVKDLKNFIYITPSGLARAYLLEKSVQRYYTFKDQLKVLDNVTKENMITLVKKLLTNNKINALISGNIQQKEAVDVISHFKPFISTDPHFKDPMPIQKIIKLEKHEIYTKNTYNKEEPDSAINIYYDIGTIKKIEDKNWALIMTQLMLIDKITKERFFTQLRSVEQSGYIVNSSMIGFGSMERTTYGLLFVIQSYKKSPDVLDKRIELFVENTLKYIKEFKKNNVFKKYKKMLINELYIKDNNIYEQFNKYLIEIKNGDSMFNYKKYIIEVLNKLTIDQFIDFYNKHFIDKTTSRVRIIKIYGKNHKKID